MAKTVTLEEATAWIKANEHRTWSHYRRYNPLGEDLPCSMEMKYLYFSFDTRDQKVFYIKTDKDSVYGSHTDEHKTVLTALEARLNGEKVVDLVQESVEELLNEMEKDVKDSIQEASKDLVR